jgi:ABC-type phosphate transport system substrate-binding protein
MSKLMRQSKQFTRLTYRGVGSSSGQYEFIGNDNNYTPFSDFGAGDVPLKQSQYDEVLQNSGEMFHFPVLIGAITFFHNIDIPDDKQLNLTPCILAKILDREIEQWSDPEILAINGPLKGYIPASSPIHVARRSDGSGSTESITQYLNEACPEHWPGDLVGKSPEWKSDTLACSGSSGMVDCIDRNQGSIGYLDTGSGHVKGFSEIKLENKDGDYITSLDALENGGVLAAATSEGSNIPDQLNESFAEVNLLNQVSFV